MGIPGFGRILHENHLIKTVYFSSKENKNFSNKDFCRQFSPENPINVIISGTALAFYIYQRNLSWVPGGQYRLFSEHLEYFLNDLKCCGMNIKHIVFEGSRAINGKEKARRRKDQEILKKVDEAMNYIKKYPEFPIHNTKCNFGSETFVLPLLAIPVAIETVQSMNIEYLVPDSDSDEAIATLSSYWDAMVIGNDTDLILMEISQNGFLHLDTIEICHDSYNNPIYLSGSFVQKSMICAQFKIPEHILPIFAVILGDDYLCVKSELIGEFYPKFLLKKYSSYQVFCQYQNDIDFSNDMERAIYTFIQAIERSWLDVNYNDIKRKNQLFPNYPPSHWLKIFLNVANRYKSPYKVQLNNDLLFQKKLKYGDGGDLNTRKQFFCTPLFEDSSRKSAWLESSCIRAATLGDKYLTDVNNNGMENNKNNWNNFVVSEHVRKHNESIIIRVNLNHEGAIQFRQNDYILRTHQSIQTSQNDLLCRSLLFLCFKKNLSDAELIATILAKVVEPIQVDNRDAKIFIKSSYIQFIALLETTLYSLSMYYSLPISKNTVSDSRMITMYLSSIDSLENCSKNTMNSFILQNAGDKSHEVNLILHSLNQGNFLSQNLKKLKWGNENW